VCYMWCGVPAAGAATTADAHRAGESRVSLHVEHHVAPSDDGPSYRVFCAASIRIITCQSASDAWAPVRHVSTAVLRPVERKTPHLALGAGGACDSSLPEMEGVLSGSTASMLGACTTSDSVLRPRISFRGHVTPRVEPTNARARGRGAMAEASASVGVESMQE
jgi:hypothetical protein